MFNHHHLKSIILGVLVLAGSVPAAVAAMPTAPVTTPIEGASRIWFLRPAGSADPLVWGASPTIYANGEPIATIPPNSSSYLDLPAGTYSFIVQPYG
jgi:hypothetical protein